MILILLSDKKIDELQFKILVILMTIVISQHYFQFNVQKYLYDIKLSHVVNAADMIVSAYS